MIIDLETITKITAFLLAVSALLGAISLCVRRTRGVWRAVGQPLWPGVLRPFLIFFFAFALLFIPNGLWLEFILRRAVSYYWIAGNQELDISNDVTFIKFVLAGAVPVSLYSYFWAALIYPRFLRWFKRPDKKLKHKPVT